MKTCNNCGKEIDDKAVVCVNCGSEVKQKKPFYKKWWFWLIIVVAVVAIGSGSGDSETPSPSLSGTETTEQTKATEPTIVYEVVDLQTMIDDLEQNAMRAEAQYQNKYIEVTGKISNFDSDGKYISIEPVTADMWNFTTVMCYIKNDAQRDVLFEKSEGDMVTIKGKIKSIGEVLGYQIDIAQIS